MSHNTTQSNIADKPHTKQEYELPENVDFTKSLQFTVKGMEDLLCYDYSPLTRKATNVKSGWSDFFEDELIQGVKHGTYLVLKQQPEVAQEELFGTTFKFEARGYQYVFGNEKIYFSHGGFVCDCTRDKAEEHLLSGFWKLIPKEAAPETLAQPFPEDSFTQAEKAINRALFPEQPSLQELAQEFGGKHGKCSWEISMKWANSTDYGFEFTVHSEEKLKKLLVAMNGVSTDGDGA